MAVTASGDVIGCGQNDEGQVRSDLPSESVLPRPSLLEPLMSHRVTQVLLRCNLVRGELMVFFAALREDGGVWY